MRFANESEREFAAILDFYQIEWLYEPTTFPIRWDETGRVVESFAPDFYLPEQDCYIELTTLKQSLVTKKNRKLRCLRQLHPNINIKLFYARDFRSLMTKYGLKSALQACNLSSPPNHNGQEHAPDALNPQPSGNPV